MSGVFLLSAATCDAQILHRKKKVNKSTSADNNAQPDKILYDKAIEDIKHGRQEVGRLNMQTLINTYPDSEYLAKAKLGIADSYFKEGGTANITQAIAGYKDFIVFFPFLPEATYAQMQVAMAHFRQMEKPDRDRTHGRAAEEEFQIFLNKYPSDPLAPQAEQHLREVQEVLAEGDYRIGAYYFVKGDNRAAAGRLMSLTRRYPLYSRSDHALWMLGEIFEKSEHKELAAQFYAQIVKNYPLSELSADAKTKLVAYKAPVPQPDPKAVAWMRAEQNTPRKHTTLVKKPLGILKNGPTNELQAAARSGPPNLQPDTDTSSGDILAGGWPSRIGGGAGTTGIVATVGVGRNSNGSAGGTESAPAPADANATNPPATSDPPKDPAAPADPPAASASTNGGATNGSNGTATSGAGGSGTADADPKSNSPAAGTPTDGSAAKPADAQNGTQNGTDPKNTKESSSKKKKGLRKIVPW
jgi:outer membrane protein assembly factor BamD